MDELKWDRREAIEEIKWCEFWLWRHVCDDWWLSRNTTEEESVHTRRADNGSMDSSIRHINSIRIH